MARREFTFTFDNQQDALTFIDLVSKKVKSKELLIRYNLYGNVVKVWIAIQGDAHEVEVYGNEVLKIYRDLKLMKGRFGVKTFDVSFILAKARLEAAIPIDIIVDILQLMGVPTEVEGSKIKVKGDMSLERLVEIAESISKLYREMMEREISSQAKRVIAIYAYLSKKPLDEAIADLLRHNIIKRYGDTELLVLSTDYTHALLKLQEILEKEGSA